MGAFDDLIPAGAPAASGAFADLLPEPGRQSTFGRIPESGAFNDLLPEGRKIDFTKFVSPPPPEPATALGQGLRAELADQFGQLGKGAAQIVPSTLKALSVLGQMSAGQDATGLEPQLYTDAIKAYREAPPEEQPMYRGGVATERVINQAIPEPEVRDVWHDVARGTGQMIPMLAGGVTAKVAGVGVRGAAAIASMMGATQEFDDAFGRARERGDDPDTAFAKSLGYATVAALIENKLGAGRLLRQFFPAPAAAVARLTALGVSKKLIGNAVAGFVEEGTQRLAQNIIVEGKPSTEGVLEEALPGGIVQGMFGIPGAFVQNRPPPSGDRKETQDTSNAGLAQRAATPAFFQQPDDMRGEATAANDRVANLIADRKPIQGADARLAGARDRLPGMGYAYNEARDEFVPVRKVEPVKSGPTSPVALPVKPVEQERLTGARLGDFQMFIGGIKTVSDLRKLRDEWDASADDPRQQHAIELINERIASFNLPRANAQPKVAEPAAEQPTTSIVVDQNAPLPAVTPGGPPSALSAEQKAVSDANNSREAFARVQVEADAKKAAEQKPTTPADVKPAASGAKEWGVGLPSRRASTIEPSTKAEAEAEVLRLKAEGHEGAYVYEYKNLPETKPIRSKPTPPAPAAVEKVVAAGLRDPATGERWSDLSHPQAWAQVPNPENRKLESGFITSTGRWVDRNEASRMANKKLGKAQTIFGSFASEAEVNAARKAAGTPEPKPAPAAAQKEIRRGEIGGQLSDGEIVTTATGRQTTSFPKLGFGSNRKAINTVKRVDAWLHENAVAEAKARGDEFNLLQFQNENPAKMPQASKDSMEQYLFGENQPPVPRPLLKPITPTPDAAKAQTIAKADATTEPGGVVRVVYRNAEGEQIGYGQLDGKVINMVSVEERYQKQGVGAAIIKDLRQRGGVYGVAGTKEGLALMRSKAVGATEYEPNKFTFEPAKAQTPRQRLTQDKGKVRRLTSKPEPTATPTDVPETIPPKVETKAPVVGTPTPTASDSKLADIRAKREEIKARLRKKLGQTNEGVDPEVATIAAELAFNYTQEGVVHFADFARKVKAELPEIWQALKQYLRGAWATAADINDNLDDVSRVEAKSVLDAIDTESSDATAPSLKLAAWVESKLNREEAFTSRELYEQGDIAFGGTQGEAKYTPKDAYDAMELGVNQAIAKDIRFKIDWAGNPDTDQPRATKAVEQLKRLVALLPTQTRRTAEMDEFQQFSTPPPLAYVVAWAGNVHPSDVVLEPSAGIGGIAVFAKNVGATVIVNELSPRRAELLKQMGFDQVFTENGEQLNNILPADVKPTVVLTNPPFSSTAGRMQGVRDTSNATVHLEQDLARLQPGGRLVAIVGEGMAADKATFKAWWRSIAGRYHVLANIGINGDEYKKYGTSFGNQIIVIDRPLPNEVVGLVPPKTGAVQKIEELIPLLEEIRNERKRTTGASEPTTAKPPRQDATAPSEATSRPQPPASVPVGGVGTGPAGPASAKPGAVARPAGQPASPTAGTAAGVLAGSGPATSTGKRPTRRRLTENPKPPGSGGPVAASAESSRTGSDTVLGQDLSVKSAEEAVAKDLEVGAVFENYRPQINIAGALPHPTPLAESAAMSSVKYPESNYKPSLPATVITSGALSGPQIEAVILAGAAHARMLPDGRRRGFFVGDGTGVGKGRTNAAILFDNWNKGHKKGVWITADQKLFPDAQRDIEGIGWNKDLLFLHKKSKPKEPLEQKQGVLFSAYSLLRNENRFKQIEDWLGKDFDGVIVFDESHKMANAVQTRGARGMKAVAGQALAGIELQAKFPKARIVYVSATGATEVSNLAYAERLGLWGEGTPFPNREAFINDIGNRGVGAMEIVAKDLKSMGLYVSRNLSFDGVTFEQLEHPLNDDQQKMYNMLAGAWQMVLNNMEAALEATGASDSGQAKSAARSAFWGAHQRFFNQLLTSLQMPTVLATIKQHVANGDSVVLQLVNTNFSQMERAISKVTESAEEDEAPDLETLDITPRETLIQYVENAFPVDQFEQYTDENGVVRSRPVLDSKGNRVKSQEALAMREALINRLAGVRVPVGALDEILETFGEANVAEVTGRTRRVVTKETPEGRKKVIENRTTAANLADRAAFNDDKKKVLVFSDAGGTGASYHADLKFQNQRKRQHIVLQAGWRADAAIQGLGRSHRSNQAQPPHFALASTDVPGHKRFISTIARRIEQLGALTKGQRQTTSQGIFNARDNLESSYARESLRAFFRAMDRGNIPGVDANEFAAQTGLKLYNEDGQFIGENIQVGQFLNRLLSLNLDMQSSVFEAFSNQLDATIEWHKKNGTLDVGMETLVAQATKVSRERTIYTDPETGAKTNLVELEQTHPTRLQNWSPAWLQEAGVDFAVNKRSGMIWRFGPVQVRARSDGSEERFRLATNSRSTHEYLKLHESEANFDPIKPEEAQALWQKSYDNAPKTYTQKVNLVTGTILPVLDRIPGFSRIARAQDDGGRRFLGVVVHENSLAEVEKNFSLEGKIELTPEQAFDQVLDDSAKLTLSNGWTISRRYVSGEPRIEIGGPDYRHQDELTRNGVIGERIAYAMRYFIPTNSEGSGILEKVIKSRPIVQISRGSASLTANTGGMSESAAQPVIAAWRNANPSAPDVETVNRPEWTQTGTDGKQYGVRGWWDGQKILVNLAFVADADAVREVLEHEQIHPLLDTAQGERAITSAITQELGGDALAKIQARYKQGASESAEQYRRRSMAEWFAQLKESNQSLRQRIVARVREFLARFKLTNLTDEEIGRAILRKLESDAGQSQTGMQEGMASQPMFSLTQEPVGDGATRVTVIDPATGERVPDEEGGEQQVQVNSIVFTVRGTDRMTPEEKSIGVARAQEYFETLGLPGTPDTSKGTMVGSIDTNAVFTIESDGKLHDDLGEQLLAHLTDQIKQLHQPTGSPAYVAALVNAITKNYSFGNMNGVFSKSMADRLVPVAVQVRSFAGSFLRSLTGIPLTMANIARNADWHLRRMHEDMFGGDLVRKIMDRIAANFRESFTGDEIERLYNANPKLQELFMNVVKRLKVKPSLREVIEEIFATRIDRQDDIVQNFVDTMVNRFSATPEEARKLKIEFGNTFVKSFAAARLKAQAKALATLLPEERKVSGAGTPLWKKLTDLVNSGWFDSAEVVEQYARSKGMVIPTEAELEQMRNWSIREQSLREPTLAEIEASDSATATAKAIAVTLEARQDLLRKMNTQWSRWTHPLASLRQPSSFLDPVRRYNTAMAANEWLTANLLLKLGFGSRQLIDVGTSMVLHTPKRAAVYAFEQWENDKSAGRDANLLDALSTSITDAYRTRLKVLGDTLASFKRTLAGKGEQKNVEQLLSSIAVFDRMLLQADEMKASGKPKAARFLHLLALTLRFGRQFAAAADIIQGVPAEAQEMAHQIRVGLREQGKGEAQQELEFNTILGLLTTARVEALADARQMLESRGLDTSKTSVQRAAWHMLREKVYQAAKNVGLPADAWKEQNHYFRNVIGWNEPETQGFGNIGGPGGAVAAGAKIGKELFSKAGIPAFPFVFGNAMGIALNRKLAYTPLGLFPGLFKGSPWFEGERNIRERKIEAVIGTTTGSILFTLAALGIWVVLPRKWPDDEKEKAKWTANGWQPGMVIIPAGDMEMKIGTRVGPLALLSPYLAAGGAMRDAMIEQAKKQKVLDERAAKLGLKAEQLSGLDPSQWLGVMAAAGWSSATGGRTASGMIGSYTDFGAFSPKKTGAAAVSSVVPGLPGFQELSRMSGSNINPKTASFWDLLVPLPTSDANRVNLLGDPMRNENDVERIFQVLSGGSALLPANSEQFLKHKAYANLFASDFRPPSINPSRGYQFGNEFRPMTEPELQRYTTAQGRNFAEALQGMDVNGMTPTQAKSAVETAFKSANNRALSDVGASVPSTTRATAAAPPAAYTPPSLAPTPRRTATGRARAAVSRSRGFGRARSSMGRSRLSTMRVPRLRTGRARAYVTRTRVRRPSRARTAMSRPRRPRRSYA